MSGFRNVVLSWDPVGGSGGDADGPIARMLKEAVKLKFSGGRAPSPIGRLVRWGREEGVGVNLVELKLACELCSRRILLLIVVISRSTLQI